MRAHLKFGAALGLTVLFIGCSSGTGGTATTGDSGQIIEDGGQDTTTADTASADTGEDDTGVDPVEDTAAPDTTEPVPDTQADTTAPECVADVECEDTPNDCLKAVCNEGKCEKEELDNGTECGEPTNCENPGACEDGTCTPSTDPFVCEDDNACTQDGCLPGTGCVFTPIENCCTEAAQCDDSDPCTTNTCQEDNTCYSSTIKSCCTSDAQCENGDPCTIDSCKADNTCKHLPIPGCLVQCENDDECDDQEQCTENTCENGTCVTTPKTNCCTDTVPCNDNNPCTSDSCVAGTCTYEAVASCCLEKGECDDNDSCTDNLCESNQCKYVDNGTCNPDDSFLLCTLDPNNTGLSTSNEIKCDVKTASTSPNLQHQFAGLQFDLSFDTANATFTGFSCPPASCQGTNGVLKSGLNIAASDASGNWTILLFPLGAVNSINDATYTNGLFSGDTYAFTLHFSFKGSNPTPVKAVGFVGANMDGKQLKVEMIDGVLVSTLP